MVAVSRVSQPKTRRGKKFLEERAPKITENDKKVLLIRGGKTSPVILQCLKDLYLLKKPLVCQMHRKNPFHLFDDDTGLEKFTEKFDASLFLFGSNSKKRPDNLVFGRMFDFHILDMIEFRVENFRSAMEFNVPKATLGTKPALIFQGEKFQTDATFKRAANLLTDCFKGETAENVRLQGLELVITFTAIENRILFRVYRTYLKKSGTRLPRVELAEVGPCMDLVLGRTKLASDDLMKTALRQPFQLRAKKTKNISHDVFGSKLARVHVGRQDIHSLQTRKMKGLRRSKEQNGQEETGQEENVDDS